MKKLIIVLLFCFIFISLFACKKENKYLELKELTESQIFTQEEEVYYVYFHKDNCTGCETVKTDVMHYNYLCSKDDTLNKIYGMNLQKENETKALIYRTYTGLSGQGDEGTFYVNTVTQWYDLYIAATPALIAVKTKDGVKTAHYIAHGASNISSYLEGLYEKDN